MFLLLIINTIPEKMRINEKIDIGHKYFMDDKNVRDSDLQGSFADHHQPLRERIGLVVDGFNAATALTTITTAEAAGVRQIWITQSPFSPDTTTIFASAAAKTSIIRLGTAIVPIYLRHPLALAQQALAIDDVAPGRFRLGIGPSHRPLIEGVYGLSHTAPLAYMREYLQVLRAALWEGKVNHHGRFFNVVVPTMSHTAKIPLLISTLGEKAFLLAGEISDGALSWLCPVQYLLKTGLPALRKTSSSRGRSEPPLVAHVLVALSQDGPLILEKGHQMLGYYTKLPFYAKMFADAGFPIKTDDDGDETIVPDALVNSLIISGSESTIAARFKELLGAGLGELMITIVPIADAHDEQTRLMHLIGRL
jgi:alkanesulfonate monooxygenase SsuD/methylene tetrahydromethanopterin reductase-like flavin-dependent oxidoreductase (luciferase family)